MMLRLNDELHNEVTEQISAQSEIQEPESH